jgi:hypothetical protein
VTQGDVTPIRERSSDDPHMRVTLHRCGECEGVSSAEAWTAAWWSERSRRMVDPKWNDDDYGPSWGIDERMVCPRCGYVHADDECSYVEDVEGVACPSQRMVTAAQLALGIPVPEGRA